MLLDKIQEKYNWETEILCQSQVFCQTVVCFDCFDDIWGRSLSSISPSKMLFLLFEILERASVSLLMLSAKQGTTGAFVS